MGCSQSSSSGPSAVDGTKTTKQDSMGVEDVFPESALPQNGSGLIGAKQKDSTISKSMAGEHSTTTRDQIKQWKEQLEASGNLAKTVVNIEVSPDKQVESVYDGVHNGQILGTGAAGIVRKCKHKQTGMDFAVKCLNIGLVESKEVIEALREEVFIMCQTDHPDIVRLEEVYESDTQIYLILHLLTGGDMFDRLEDQPDFCYSEIRCAHMVNQMMSAVRYLHENKVIHRDLKLENFIFDNEKTDSLRLIDFGLSKHFGESGEKHNLAVGTPYTVAPEIIMGEYDEKVDIWALGVITYLLLCGETPFGGMDGECMLTVKQNILEGELEFEPSDIWDGISEDAKNFVRRLLTKDPEKRPTAREAQHDKWLVECAAIDADQSKPLSSNMVKHLREFKDYNKMQKLLLEVVSFTLLPEQIMGLKEEFEKLDIDGNGEITLEELKEVLLGSHESSDHGDSNSSLLSLTEDEVELIFDSLHLNTKEKTIKWHQFISAGLSQCNYDDRNLRLAFNRLDHGGKGYITIDDLNEMIRTNDGSMDEMILEMWKEGVQSVQCKCKDKISYEDFQCFFKSTSQTQQSPNRRSSIVKMRRETMKEASTPNRLSYSRLSQHLSSMTMSSERLLASTLALDFSDSHSNEENISNGVGSEEKAGSSRSSSRKRRSSSGAILIQSRASLE